MGETISKEQQDYIAASTVPGAMPGGNVPFGSANGLGMQPQSLDQNALAKVGDSSMAESALLSQLVQTLGGRLKHSLLLSDLGALLPGNLRHGVKEKGGLRSWLQKYPELFAITGQPGKESVTLILGPKPFDGAAGVVDAGRMQQASFTGAPERMSVPVMAGEVVRGAQAANGLDMDQRKKGEDDDNDSAVQLRGLPFRATVTDIRNFLGNHTRNLKDDSSVQLVLNRDGRPSGFARVQFSSPAAARAARDSLHMHVMEIGGQAPSQGGPERYVEIFLFSERPNKLRFKKVTTGENTVSGMAEDDEAAAMGVTKDQVVAECRDHMMQQGKGQLLLSMLGVALSHGSRMYLKKTDQGLKHFLAQYPQEFVVDGAKGRECITYLPVAGKFLADGRPNCDLPTGFSEPQQQQQQQQQQLQQPRKMLEQEKAPPARRPEGNGSFASGSINDMHMQHMQSMQHMQQMPRWEDPALIPQSPKPAELRAGDTPKLLDTPSDWGTPMPAGWDPREIGRPTATRQPANDVNNRAAAAAALPSDASGAGVGAANPYLSAEQLANQPWGMPPGNAWSMPPNAAFWPPFWPPQGAGAHQMPGAFPTAAPSAFPTPEDIQAMLAAGAPPLWAGALAQRPAPVPFPGGMAGTHPGAMGQYLGGQPAPVASTMEQLAGQFAMTGPMAGQHALMPEMQPPMQQQGQPQATADVSANQGSDSVSSPSTLILRGLPFQSTEQDVLAFFAKHDLVEFIQDGSTAVRMSTKANGKPSGLALVDMTSHQHAQWSAQALNGQYMGARYVEVFLQSEGDGSSQPGPSRPETPSAQNSHVAFTPHGTPSSFGGSPTFGGTGGAPCEQASKSLLHGSFSQAAPVPPAARQPVQMPRANVPAPAPLALMPAGMGGLAAAGDTGGSGGPAGPEAVDYAASGVKEDQQQSSWEALFDFLKNDAAGSAGQPPPVPPVDALGGLR